MKFLRFFLAFFADNKQMLWKEMKLTQKGEKSKEI